MENQKVINTIHVYATMIIMIMHCINKSISKALGYDNESRTTHVICIEATVSENTIVDMESAHV